MQPISPLRILVLFMAALVLLSSASQAAAQGPTPGPESSGRAAPGPGIVYIVRPGDTLWAIASRYGATVPAIKNVNNLISDVIYSGQRLFIPTSEPLPPSNEVIVDETSPGFQRLGNPPGWFEAAAGYNDHMLWTFNNQVLRPNTNSARWVPQLAPGTYEVFAYIPRLYAFTRRAAYQIQHADGMTPRTLNQALYFNQWVSLGTYRFNGDAQEFVMLSDVTGEAYLSTRIGFDAMRWTRR